MFQEHGFKNASWTKGVGNTDNLNNLQPKFQMNLKETGCEGLHWIKPNQDRVHGGPL